MEIITANKKFNSEEYHVSLMTTGVYVYHDPLTKNLVDKNNIVWEEYSTSYGYTYDFKYFKSLEINKLLEWFPNIVFRQPVLYYGIDNGSGVWHDDLRENLVIQIINYQEDLYPEDGGSIRIKCYDHIERWYYPKNGDVLVLNHIPPIPHMVEKILSDKKRIALNLNFGRSSL